MREGVVVFLGTLAKHLGAQDPKRLAVVETLVDVLRWVPPVPWLRVSRSFVAVTPGGCKKLLSVPGSKRSVQGF